MHCVRKAVNYENELLHCVVTVIIQYILQSEMYPVDVALRICPGSVLGTLLQAYGKTCMKRIHCERSSYIY